MDKVLIKMSEIKQVTFGPGIYESHEHSTEIVDAYLSDYGLDADDAWARCDELGKKFAQISFEYMKGYAEAFEEYILDILPEVDFVVGSDLSGIRILLIDGTVIEDDFHKAGYLWKLVGEDGEITPFTTSFWGDGMAQAKEVLDYLFLPLIQKEKVRVRQEVSRLKKKKEKKQISFWADKELAKKLKLKADEDGLNVGEFIIKELKAVV